MLTDMQYQELKDFAYLNAGRMQLNREEAETALHEAVKLITKDNLSSDVWQFTIMVELQKEMEKVFAGKEGYVFKPGKRIVSDG